MEGAPEARGRRATGWIPKCLEVCRGDVEQWGMTGAERAGGFVDGDEVTELEEVGLHPRTDVLQAVAEVGNSVIGVWLGFDIDVDIISITVEIDEVVPNYLDKWEQVENRTL
ncbi:hypothetical protein SKAU_G00150860 [Synaphobranchus kaupii]|uniref:Uncharacterized protein n=1 Tax=Synaphobranchus kaupii TaxID=118154 RepID=A0A9Q1IXV7_SYNKA|nr:hypothetical protein SKAU_G00150860 [Synaphobranchus kaupii]